VFEDIRKRINEKGSADADVYEKYKTVTLWKAFLLREIYSSVMGSYLKISMPSKLSPSLTSVDKRFRS
jgi:hypothetical protein